MIKQATPSDIPLVFDLLKACRADMVARQIMQWNANYPTINLVKADVNSGQLFCLKSDDKLIGVITFDTNQSPEYEDIKWQYHGAKIMVIHRLAVHPDAQKKGIGRQLMDFALNHAKTHQYHAIRLDAYSGNDRTISFYKKRHYEYRGDIYFPGRSLPFFCFEKRINIEP